MRMTIRNVCEEDCGWSDEHISYGRNSNNRRDKQTGETIWYNYDTQLRLIFMVYNYVDYSMYEIHREISLLSIDKARNTVVEYKYDSWGQGRGCQWKYGGSPGKKIHFGIEDTIMMRETGLYDVSSRYRY